MNQLLKKLDIEKILFFDIRFKSRELDLLDPRINFLINKKGIEAEDKERLDNLTWLGYTEITSIALAFVKDGTIYTKLLTGSDASLIGAFCDTCTKFSVLAGVNAIGFKLPLILANGARYFDMTSILPEQFNTSGKKPWDIKFVVDITEQFKGTYYISPNLYDMCYHFGIDFSITDDIKSDMLSTVLLYARMSGVELNGQVQDKTTQAGDSTALVVDDRNLFQKIYDNGLASNMKEIKEFIASSTDIEKSKELLLSAYVHNNFASNDEDKKDVKEAKRLEVEGLFNA